VQGGEPRLGDGDACCGLAGFQRLIAAQIIETPARVGLDIAQRFVFLDEVIQHDGQQRVLLDIGEVSGVEQVLIAEHAGL
jgi:hypothetical protein